MQSGRTDEFKPCLRSVEAIQLPDDVAEGQIAIRDVSGISDVVLTVSAAALHLLSLMNGKQTVSQICREFHRAIGYEIGADKVQSMIDHLEQAHFLESESFECYYRDLLNTYRHEGVRVMPDAEGLGISGANREIFESMLKAVRVDGPGSDGTEFRSPTQPFGRFNPATPDAIRGIVALTLIIPRGAPCYGLAYEMIRKRRTPDRVVILGTNHFGRSSGVVGTASDFETPLGTTRCDVEFIERLETRCGPLRTFELDHEREHSIELQVAWLQHLYGAGNFTIVPFLCPDPCGPSGTGPWDGHGVDLGEFASSLGEFIDMDEADTLIVAGADLSHVGESFGDERQLDDAFLDEVRAHDNNALSAYVEQGPHAFVEVVTNEVNRTRICSVGCMFALALALDAPTLLCSAIIRLSTRSRSAA